MVKIERLFNECKATLKDGSQVFGGQLLTHEDFEMLKVITGSLLVSIDEKELKTIGAEIPKMPELMGTAETTKEVDAFKENMLVSLTKEKEAKAEELMTARAKEIQSAKTPQNIKPVEKPKK